jgi:hypothetical protein
LDLTLYANGIYIVIVAREDKAPLGSDPFDYAQGRL